MLNRVVRALTGACCLLSLSAFAAPVTWTLSPVSLGDGGTASGSYTYDAATNTFSGIDITTTGGSTRSGGVYSFPSSVANASAADFLSLALPVDVGVTARFDMFLSAPMTDAGGTLSGSIEEFTCINADCSFTTGTEPGLGLREADTVVTTSAVPEPNAMPMLGLALLALGGVKRLGQRGRRGDGPAQSRR